jgi:hypothetical protein
VDGAAVGGADAHLPLAAVVDLEALGVAPSAGPVDDREAADGREDEERDERARGGRDDAEDGTDGDRRPSGDGCPLHLVESPPQVRRRHEARDGNKRQHRRERAPREGHRADRAQRREEAAAHQRQLPVVAADGGPRPVTALDRGDVLEVDTRGAAAVAHPEQPPVGHPERDVRPGGPLREADRVGRRQALVSGEVLPESISGS